MVRQNHAGTSADDGDQARLNLMLSCTRWRAGGAIDQLPSLLSPMGISSHRVAAVDEAEALLREVPVHIAVVDLEMPLRCEADDTAEPCGERVLQLIRRLDMAPPTVVVRPRQATTRESRRGLAAALREGAFAVLDRPLHLETMLDTMRRVVRRYYDDVWPSGAGG